MLSSERTKLRRSYLRLRFMRNLQSAICNLQSAICNLQSAEFRLP